MAWVDAADMMYLTGLEQYSDSVFLHIAYANFLSTYKKSAMVRSTTSNCCSAVSGIPKAAYRIQLATALNSNK